MGAPKKYRDELRQRAIRLVMDAQKNPDGRRGAGTTTEDTTRLAELEREVAQLRRENAILRAASAFFAAELDRTSRPHLPTMIAHIDAYKERVRDRADLQAVAERPLHLQRSEGTPRVEAGCQRLTCALPWLRAR